MFLPGALYLFDGKTAMSMHRTFSHSLSGTLPYSYILNSYRLSAPAWRMARDVIE